MRSVGLGSHQKVNSLSSSVDSLFARAFLLLHENGFKPERLNHHADPVLVSDYALTSHRSNRDFATASFFDNHVKARKYEKHGSNFTRVSEVVEFEYANPEFPRNLVKYLKEFHGRLS